MAGGFRESSSKGKERERVTPQRGEGSTRQQCFRQQTEGGDSVEKEAQYEADEEGSDHHEDETTKPTPAPPGPPGDSSSEESNSESDRPRSPPPPTKPRQATTRNFEREKSPEEQEWQSLTGVIAHRRTTKHSKALKGIKLDPTETLDGDDNKWKNSQRFDGWVNTLERFLAFKDIDLNDRNALEFVGFKVTNSALVLYNPFQREEQEKDQTFFKFMLALWKFLIPSISEDLLWKEWQTITPTKGGKNMGVHRFARALDDMQSKLIDKQGHKSIIEEVKISKFLNNMSDVINKSLTPDLTDDMTCNQIVTK